MRQYVIVDGDGHYAEPIDMWTEYTEQRFHGFAPRTVELGDGSDIIVWPHMRGDTALTPDGVPPLVQGVRIGSGDEITPGGYHEGGPKGRPYAQGHPGGFDPHLRLADMDLDGVHAAVVFPSHGLTVPSIPDLDAQLALVEAVNRFAADYCAADPARLFAVALLPTAMPQRAAEMLRFYVERHGFVAGMIRPNPLPPNGVLVSDPALDTVWKTAQDLGVPIAVHEGAAKAYSALGDDRSPDVISRHIMCHPFEQMAAFVSLYMTGVFERFPGLRVGMLEAGSGWFPYLVERIDEHLEMMGWMRPDLKARPSDLVRDRGFVVSVEGEDPFVPVVASMLGDHVPVWASDYPHRDAKFPGVAEDVLARTDLTDELRAAVLGGNAMRFYGLTRVGEPRPVDAARVSSVR